jgi:hypothetical protein
MQLVSQNVGEPPGLHEQKAKAIVTEIAMTIAKMDLMVGFFK